MWRPGGAVWRWRAGKEEGEGGEGGGREEGVRFDGRGRERSGGTGSLGLCLVVVGVRVVMVVREGGGRGSSKQGGGHRPGPVLSTWGCVGAPGKGARGAEGWGGGEGGGVHSEIEGAGLGLMAADHVEGVEDAGPCRALQPCCCPRHITTRCYTAPD